MERKVEYNGRQFERAYGALDADAQYIMENVEGLVETMRLERMTDSTHAGAFRASLDAQIGILEQIVEIAYDRNIEAKYADA